MISRKYFVILILALALQACNSDKNTLDVKIFETSKGGNQQSLVNPVLDVDSGIVVKLLPDARFQEIVGIGGAFTESSAYLLNQLSAAKRAQVIEAYFGKEGARYSLTRTHINSCDFSLSNYSYAPEEGDVELENFSIEEDRDDLIPMIEDAMKVSEDGFKILASPWTAPPWMKDNKGWKGGKLLPEYYETWALFFSKYISEYKKEGIDIWGLTVENEPLGNNSNWESMHYSPEGTVDFTRNFLGPKLEEDGHDVQIFGYDQNRGKELEEWVDVLFADEESSKYFDGTAVHWYSSTVSWMPASLEYAHEKAPGKYLFHTEGCIDAEIPHWQEDEWYWQAEATDWGWDWATGDDRLHHPKYAPVYRYAGDIIGCLNTWVDGWIDWNMVLDRQGGPNWAKNWCIAPVIVDPEQDEVYFTPLYYVMSHFSRYIRPGAVRIGFDCADEELMMTAVENPDGTFAVVFLNKDAKSKYIHLALGEKSVDMKISGEALQTVLVL